MMPPSLSDRLLEAITTQAQDARADSGDSPRVRQRLDAMIDALGVVEAAELQAAKLAVSRAATAARPMPQFRNRLTGRLPGRRP